MQKPLEKLKSSDSIISITLGFLIVIGVGLMIYNYFSKNKLINTSETSKEGTKEETTSLPTVHKISEGETLWSIAEKYYNSGYNWITIAKENNLVDSNSITVNQQLTIPKAETIRPTEDKILTTASETEKTYTVVAGDNLWNIAIKEYGDGYAWTKIATANNLVNPHLIHAGNVLKLP